MPRAVKKNIKTIKGAEGTKNKNNSSQPAKKKNFYAKPEKIPHGEVLTDISKNQWKIGPSIGSGGFGEIYTACKINTSPKNLKDYDYVVKVEPHENGPLFVEKHFYMRNAKQDDINKFCKKKGLKSIGMPFLIGSGSHELNGIKHRFIIMPRYGKDIWSIFIANGRKLLEHTVYRLAIQMLDVFEYIHGCGYVHADLKGTNILLGLGKSGASQAFLVDFGLASHYTTKEFKPDAKKMHNGTIEYTSRDAHNGVATMRGDLEILGYNLINWMGVSLPWELSNCLGNPSKVQNEKEEFMKNTDKSLEKLFKKVPIPLKEFFKYISSLKYNEIPNYEKCKKIFDSGLKILGKTNSGDLDFEIDNKAGNLKGKSTTDDFEPKLTPKRINSRKLISSKGGKSAKNIIPDEDKSNDEEIEIEATPPKKLKIGKKETVETNTSERAKRYRKRTPEESPAGLQGKSEERLPNESPRKYGKTVINNNIKQNKSSNKTYECNLELDISFDANIVVNVTRKKKGSNEKEKEEDAQENKIKPIVVVKKLDVNDKKHIKKRI